MTDIISTDYIIGMPSGQIIDVKHPDINKLKQSGNIVLNKNLNHFIFNDENYDEILKILKRTDLYLRDMISFFDAQKNQRGWEINTDHSLEVSGNIYISGASYTKIPFNFKKVSGDFIFKDCNLDSLEGSPEDVGGSFIVSGNKLTDLKGGPKYVGNLYDCSKNFLSSLKGAPEIIRGDFDCSTNFLQTLDDGPKKIKGFYDCTNNNQLRTIGEQPDCKRLIRYGMPQSGVFKKFRDEGEGKYRW